MPERPLIPLGPEPQQRSAHLTGICGAGMRALAELLSDWGWRITGSDASPSDRQRWALARRGIDVCDGHRAENLPARADLLIYSAAVPAENPERVAARGRGMEEVPYPAMIGRLMNSRTGIAIAGTHGKSTVTALLGWILRSAGRDASLLCGAELCGMDSAGWGGRDRVLVAESCEYRRHFLQLRPQFGAVLDIEPDHFDCFRDESDAVSAYAAFVRSIPADGLLVCRGGCLGKVVERGNAQARVETFDTDRPARWTARGIESSGRQTRFDVEYEGRSWGVCRLPIPGRHNVRNALAAAALAVALGVERDAVADGLSTFPGLRRRFEWLGAWRGADLIDDYAHHPTSIRAVLRTARSLFGERRVWAVFQPHQVSRTRALFREFSASLALADEVLVSPVYAAREQVEREPVELAEALAKRVRMSQGRGRFVSSLDHVVSTLETDARPGDVVVMMGAGDIEQVRDELCRRIQRNHAS